METSSYWKQFECTGKIQDYLSYKRNEWTESEGAEHQKTCEDRRKNADGKASREEQCRNSFT